MTAGLLAKAALYPLHLWLPPAHAGAPAPASAILSGLVVKAPFFLVVRLWFDVMPRLPDRAAAQLLGILGAAAILFGSVLALRQVRLKLLIAYSTVAQIGYLFLMFPLAGGARDGPSVGHFRLDRRRAAGHLARLCQGRHVHGGRADRRGARARPDCRARRHRPGACRSPSLRSALGGMSLMGLPPSGGFVAKAMLLTAAVAEGQWWWAVVVLVGGLLAGGYVFLVLARALADPNEPLSLLAHISREPAGGGVGAGAVCGAARLRAAAAIGTAADRPSRQRP